LEASFTSLDYAVKENRWEIMMNLKINSLLTLNVFETMQIYMNE